MQKLQFAGEDEPSSTDCTDDLNLLLDCLRYHHGSRHHGSPQRQALTTIAAMCSNDSGARDQMRRCGALSFVLEMVYSEPVSSTLQTALMTLGCASEKNVVNQSKLCDGRLFRQLSALLSSPSSTPALLHSTAYLLACLMAGNGKGQNLAREASTLTVLTALFKSLLPCVVPGVKREDGVTCAGSEGVEVWKSVVSALCTATNNPQNEANQQVCSAVLPAAMTLLTPGANQKNVQSALALITSCIASNASVQSRFSMVGGLHCLISALRRTVEGEDKDKEEEEEKAEEGMRLHLVQCISAAALGHTSNSSKLRSLGCVSLLVTLLRTPSLPLPSITAITLCLGLLTEDNIDAQRQVVKCGGLPVIVTNMAEYKDEELSKAATFVLQCCFHNKPSDQHCGGDEVCAAVSSLDPDLLEPHATQHTASLPTTLVSQSDVVRVRDTRLTETALKKLDGKKRPVLAEVSSWLQHTTMSPCTSSLELPRLQLLQQLLEGINLSSLTAGTALQSEKESVTTVQHSEKPHRKLGDVTAERAKVEEKEGRSVPLHEVRDALLDSEGKAGGESEEKEGCGRDSEQNIRCSVDDLRLAQADSTQRVPRTKDDRQGTDDRQTKDEQNVRDDRQGRDDQQSTNNRQAREKQQTRDDQYTRDGGLLDDSKTATPKVSIQLSTVRQSRQHHLFKTPSTSGRSNTRYATSCGRCKHPLRPRPPLVKVISLCNDIRPPQQQALEKAQGSDHRDILEAQSPQPPSCSLRHPPPTSDHLPSTPHHPSPSSYHPPPTSHNQPSTSHNQPSTSHPLSADSYHCLVCQPRLTCPLITSRTFLRVLHGDSYTCAYHRRLGARLMQRDTEKRGIDKTVSRAEERSDGPSVVTQDTPISNSEDYYSYERLDANSFASSADSDVTYSPLSQPSSDSMELYTPPLSCQIDSTDDSGSYEGSDVGDDDRLACPGPLVVRPHSILAVVNSHTDNSRKLVTSGAQSKANNNKREDTTLRHKPQRCVKQYQLCHGPSKARQMAEKASQPRETQRPALRERGNVQQPALEGRVNSQCRLSEYDYSTPLHERHTYHHAGMRCKTGQENTATYMYKSYHHRHGTAFSQHEVAQLMEGVRCMGRRWAHILRAYSFHTSRTALSLKDKYRNLTQRR